MLESIKHTHLPSEKLKTISSLALIFWASDWICIDDARQYFPQLWEMLTWGHLICTTWGICEVGGVFLSSSRTLGGLGVCGSRSVGIPLHMSQHSPHVMSHGHARPCGVCSSSSAAYFVYERASRADQCPCWGLCHSWPILDESSWISGLQGRQKSCVLIISAAS